MTFTVLTATFISLGHGKTLLVGKFFLRALIAATLHGSLRWR
jgi:hypothetical protein